MIKHVLISSVMVFALPGDGIARTQHHEYPAHHHHHEPVGPTHYNNTLLLDASKRGDLKMVEFALGSGADINARTKNGDTALMLASQEGHVDIVKHLVAEKAGIYLTSHAGHTALDFAADPKLYKDEKDKENKFAIIQILGEFYYLGKLEQARGADWIKYMNVKIYAWPVGGDHDFSEILIDRSTVQKDGLEEDAIFLFHGVTKTFLRRLPLISRDADVVIKPAK